MQDATLFDGDDRLFKSLLTGAERYGEYGMGASTLWVARNTSAQLRAVDTSHDWVKSTIQNSGQRRNAEYLWIDVGPLGEWGTPITFKKRDNFKSYVWAIWEEGYLPEVVLIDGRFRVCCFLHSLLMAPPGTHILFDDYRDRPWYHVAEEFAPVRERCGRQVLFEVPLMFDRDAATRARDQFLFVKE